LRCHPERSEGPHNWWSITQWNLCIQIFDCAVPRSARDDRSLAMDL